MPNTKLTKAKFKNHLHYTKWLYVIGIIATILVCDIAFTTTRYQSPDEKSVVIQLVDSYADADPLGEIAGKMLESGKLYDETLELVEFYALNYSGDGQSDYYGSQKFMIETMAGQNDLFLVPEILMPGLIVEGYCVPLEEFPELYARLIEKVPEEDLYWENEIGEEIGVDEYGYEQYEVLDARHPYAVPCDELNEFINLNSYDVTGKYMLISVTSKNIPTSYNAMLDLIDLTQLPLAEPEEEANR